MAQTWWTVRLNGKKIDNIPCDSSMKKDDVLNDLIKHDGYDPNITISKERAKKPKKAKEQWTIVDDANIRHIWAKPDGTGEIAIAPDYYQDNGTPVVDSDDEEYGDDDMIYVRTEIKNS
jgi:hypothetical protein